MRAGFVISVGAHLGFAAALIVAAPAPRPLTLSETPHMVVELVDIAEETVIAEQPPEPFVEPEEPEPAPAAQPVARPEPALETPPPPPAPEPEPEPVVEPEPTPEPVPEPEPVVDPEPAPAPPEPQEREIAEAQPAPPPVRRPDPVPEPQTQPEPEQAVEPETEAEPEPELESDFDIAGLSALLNKRLEDRVESNVVSRDANANNNASGSLTSDRDTDQPQNLRITVSEIDAVRQQYYRCWNLPLGAPADRDLRVQVRVELSPEGNLQNRTMLTSQSRINADPFLRAMAASVERAVERCSPLQALPKTKYESWRVIELTFDPSDLLG